MNCNHPEAQRVILVSHGTYELVWEHCAACDAKRPELDNGDGWGPWESGTGARKGSDDESD